MFEVNSGIWRQIGDDIDGEGVEDFSGRSVSMSSDGKRVAIGANKNDGNIPHSNADISKARDMLGYEPKISFEESIT